MRIRSWDDVDEPLTAPLRRSALPGRVRTVACAALLALAATACGSDPGARSVEPRRQDPAPAADDPNRVSIPPAVAQQLEDWMARDATVIGDGVVIEATRIPFAAQVGIESSRDVGEDGRRIVEKREFVDPATGATTVELTNRSGVQTVVDALPRMRLGGGRLFIATDKIVLRYVPASGMDRPVAISVVATGRARLVEATPARRLAGGAIELRADIVRGPAGYEFRQSEERRP